MNWFKRHPKFMGTVIGFAVVAAMFSLFVGESAFYTHSAF
jgi:hypothetical protein